MLRGGYGIGYYRVEGNDIYGLVGNPPFANIISVFNPPLDDPSRGSIGADRPKNVVTIDPIYSVPMVQTYSFGVQHQIATNTAVAASYVGSRGTHLDRGRQLNYPLPGDGLDFDPRLNTRQIALEQLAPFQGWSAITQRENTASSTYHSLQVDFNRAYRNGLRFQAVYTLSKVITDADSFGAQPQDPRDLEAERALAGFDRTHAAVFNYIYELPFWRSPSNAAFQAPAPGRFGNAGRNLVRGPGINKWDIGLFKNFRLQEQLNLQFRWETFNTFNHTNFWGVSSTLGAGNFGQVTSARDGRVMQFALKLDF